MPNEFDESLLRQIDPSRYIKELLKNDIRADGRASKNIRLPKITIGQSV